MRSKTSFFNRTLFLKSVTRFWPLWAAYLGTWFLITPVSLHATLRWNGNALAAERVMLNTATDGGIIMGAVSAILAVMAVWSFLYQSRSMSGTASLPLRRENVFVSVSLGGLVPLLAANVLVAAASTAVIALHGAADPASLMSTLDWLIIVSLELVFFYGFALLCAQLTGNILVLPAVYTVLNFTAYVVEGVFSSICSYFVYGMDYSGEGTLFTLLSPVLGMFSTLSVRNEQAYVSSTKYYDVVGYHFEGWGALIAYAAVGMLLAALALWLYRRRQMETAGDVVAVDILKPVFKYCLTFGCALVLGLMFYSVAGIDDHPGLRGMLPLLGLMLAGAAIGYFAAVMLIRKSFAVWRGNWRGLGLSLAVVALVIAAMEREKYGLSSGRVYTQQQNCWIDYTLKNGKTLSRRYELYYQMNVPETYGDTLTLQTVLNCQEVIDARKETAFVLSADNIIEGYVRGMVREEEIAPMEAMDGAVLDELYSLDSGLHLEVPGDVANYPDETFVARYRWYFSAEELEELYYDCILPDIADGTLGRIWLISDTEFDRSVYHCSISIDGRIPRAETHPGEPYGDPYTYEYFNTNPTVDSWRTNAWLTEHGIPLHSYAELAQLEN